MPGRDFDEFFAGHYDAVARALTLATGSRDLAEKATQEAFTRALRRWRSVRAMDRPVSWVYVVGMNHLRDRYRRSRRETPAGVSVADDHAGGVAVRVSVRDTIETLPPRQREAVVLRDLADLSVAEVADAMGCALGTAKATLHQALAAMRVELEDENAD